ncbi:MAG: hypothetical protein CMJ34_13345 [Phycisphaerae bacterium]|nr:hypothetical protein [Phycisphaerae bacterium]
MSAESAVQSFHIRRDVLWKAPLLLIGAVESNSRVQVSESMLDIQFGAFSTTIPIADIVSVEAVSWPIYRGIGIRLSLQRTLGLVGSTDGVVQLKLRNTGVSFLGIKCNTVSVSLDAPDSFIAAVQAVMPT